MFCLIDLSCEWDFYNIKVDPDYGAELCETYRGISPGFHMNKRHWISVRFQYDVPDRMQEDLILNSYCQVARKLPKKEQERLGITEMLHQL